jgi:hypothetical protein
MNFASAALCAAEEVVALAPLAVDEFDGSAGC